MTSAIRADGLSKFFMVPRARAATADPRREPAGRRDRFFALRDVSFSVPPGQSVGIIGANGSGKTTLLKLLAGVMTPGAGSVSVAGSVGALLEVGAGFHPDLTGEENVRVHGALLGLSRMEISRQLAEIIELAGMERFMDMPVRHYSSGMVVRLGFATAVQLRPSVLLLDETLAVGDAVFQSRAAARVAAMRAAGVNLVIVSHNVLQILEMADRVLWLDHGRLVMDGSPHEVLARYRERMGTVGLGGSRLFNQLVGHAGSMRVRESGAAARIASADWISPEPDQSAPAPNQSESAPMESGAAPTESDSAATGPEPHSIESGAPLAISVTLARPEDAAAVPLILEAWFMRGEDRRETAFTRVELPVPPPSPLRVEWPALPLCGGRYTVTLTLRRAGASDPTLAESRFILPRPLVISTPPPMYFTIAATLPARWECGAPAER